MRTFNNIIMAMAIVFNLSVGNYHVLVWILASMAWMNLYFMTLSENAKRREWTDYDNEGDGNDG